MGRGGNLEASVRKVFPKDEYIVLAVLGSWCTVGGVAKLALGGGKKAAPAAKVAEAAAVSSGASTSKWGFEPPTLDNFDTWEQNAANWDKWETFMANDALVEQWCDTVE